MTVAIEDLPPLMWHAELGDKLTDVWTGTNHRGVQLNDARQAVERWMQRYGQRCWLRQLTPDADRQQENRLLRVIARMDGTPFPSTARLTLRWLRGQLPTRYDWVRGIPFLDTYVRESTRRRREEQRQGRFESAYCAETVAVTYEEMGLIETEKRTNWFDPGRFWSGDDTAAGSAVLLGRRNRRGRRLNQSTAQVGLRRSRHVQQVLIRRVRVRPMLGNVFWRMPGLQLLAHRVAAAQQVFP